MPNGVLRPTDRRDAGSPTMNDDPHRGDDRRRSDGRDRPDGRPIAPGAPGGEAAIDELERAVRSLVRRMTERVEPQERARLTDDRRSEVLLDVEVDGVRCVFLRPTREAPHLPLSPREQEIARMVARGYPNKTIAAVLDISTWTVSTHLRRMFAKFGVTSRAAMVARSLESRDDERGGFPG